MLQAPSHPTNRAPLSFPAQLSVAANNFSKYNDYWMTISAFSFGKSGEQLRTNNPLPLSYPKPVRNNLRIHTVTREPIQGDYVYKREPVTDVATLAMLADLNAIEKAIYTDNLPLSDASQAKFDRDEVAHKHDLDLRVKDDNDCHAMLAADISPDSQSSIRLHAGYQAYLTCPEPYHRSLFFHRILASLHRYGDASTKHLRTSALFHLKQEGPFAPFLDDFNGKFDQFIADFESAEQPGFVHIGELKSFLVLNSVDRKQFRSVFDEQLRATPTGRFPDSISLIKIISDYDHHHKMSLADPVSNQGSAFIAPALAASNTDAELRPRKPRTNKDPCPHCLKRYPKQPHYGHTGAACSLNPANKKSLAAVITPDVPEANDTATVASLVLSQRRLEQSVASLVAALSLDQDADIEP
jgi:hypothetical protein